MSDADGIFYVNALIFTLLAVLALYMAKLNSPG